MIHLKTIIDLRITDVYFLNREKFISLLSKKKTSGDPDGISNNDVSFQSDIEIKNVKEDIKKSVIIALKHKEHGANTLFASINEEIVGVYCFSDLNKYIPYNYINTIERNGKCGIIFHCRTSETYRGRGIYTRALRKICTDYGPLFDNIIITAGSRNAASKGGILNTGFERKMRMTQVKILNVQRVLFRNSVP